MRSFDLILLLGALSFALYLLGPSPLDSSSADPAPSEKSAGPRPRLVLLRCEAGFRAILEAPADWRTPPRELTLRGPDGRILATSDEAPLVHTVPEGWIRLEGRVLGADGQEAQIVVER